ELAIDERLVPGHQILEHRRGKHHGNGPLAFHQGLDHLITDALRPTVVDASYYEEPHSPGKLNHTQHEIPRGHTFRLRLKVIGARPLSGAGFRTTSEIIEDSIKPREEPV